MCKSCSSSEDYKKTGYCKECYKSKIAKNRECTTIDCTNMTPNGVCGTCRKKSIDPDIIARLVVKHFAPTPKPR